MKPQESTCSKPTPSIANLTGRLPTLSREAARATRIGFDRRFPSWLATNFGPSVATARPFVAPPEQLVLELVCAYGALSLAIDVAPWPALRLAAQLPDPQQASEVAEILLQAAQTAGGAILPELKLSAIRLSRLAKLLPSPAPVLMIDTMPATLAGMDATLADAVLALLRQAPGTDAGAFSALRLPSRLRLFNRNLRWSRLCALGVGDIVLSGLMRQEQGRWPITLVFGTDNTMQTQASIDINSTAPQLQVDAPLHRVSEPPPAEASALPGELNELQVPVAFEIDSTLLSLAEISALGPGAVIELDVALASARVRLISHGQALGSGQLVAVGDQLGVRIDRMGLSTTPTRGDHR